ncbi:MAG: hypothetical protein HY228_01335 [Candidatus Yonathbacteria bacterium]|nr:hypothetical protein [Candidatus Yonathbacteria bacterium]
MEPTNKIRTMKKDIAEAIKEQDETLVSIALAERKQQEQATQKEGLAREQGAQAQAVGEQGAPKRRGRVFLVTTVFFIIIIVIPAGWISFKFLLPKLYSVNLPPLSIQNFNFSNQPIEQATTTITVEHAILLAPSLIPAQSEKRLDTSKNTPQHILALITVEKTAGLNIGDIENLYFTKESSPQEGAPLETTPLSADKFLAFGGVFAPEMLIRSLESPFMAGLFGEDSGATPFIILKVSSYETGLAGMLAFEEHIPYLFNTVFGMNIETQTTEKRSAFHTIVVLGRDARLFGGDSRQSVAYAFADTETIVIAGSQNALGKIMLIVAGK